MNQGPGDGHPLHLPARKLRGRLRVFLPMPIGGEHLAGACRTAGSLLQPAITRGIAAFSAAVKAGRRLYCWNTKPMFLARNRVFVRSLIVVMSLPKMATSPSSASRMPAITDSKRRLAAAGGPDDQRHLTRVDVQIDAGQRLDALVAGPEVLGQPADPHATISAGARFCLGNTRVFDRGHLTAPSSGTTTVTAVLWSDGLSTRKTMAGSSRMTRWTESRLASTQIRMMATAVVGSSCQGV